MSSRPARWRTLFPLVAVLLVSACSGDFAASLGPGTGTGGSPGGTLFGKTPDALIGRWSRVETSDGFGGGIVTQTTWEFASGGAATRTITILTTVGTTLSTSTVQVRWNAGAGVVILDFGAPSFRILRVPFVVDFGLQSTTLFLDGVPYIRAD